MQLSNSQVQNLTSAGRDQVDLMYNARKKTEMAGGSLSAEAEKKIAMFPPYRPGEAFFLLTRAREKSTIPFFHFFLSHSNSSFIFCAIQ